MPKTTTAQVLHLGAICPSCARVLVNDDDSHLPREEAWIVRAILAAIRRDSGAASLTTDPMPVDGYFLCGVCGESNIGDAYRLHGWRD